MTIAPSPCRTRTATPDELPSLLVLTALPQKLCLPFFVHQLEASSICEPSTSLVSCMATRRALVCSITDLAVRQHEPFSWQITKPQFSVSLVWATTGRSSPLLLSFG